MTDTDKILQALARLEAGQLTLQETVNQQGKAVTGLQEGQKTLQTDVKALQTDVKALKEGQKTLDLKVEVFHTEQTKANQEILGALTEVIEINAQYTDKRLTRIEKHLNLPPLK